MANSNPDGLRIFQFEVTHSPHIWTIDNFSGLSKGKYDSERRLLFTLDAPSLKTKWELRMYPNVKKESEDYVGIYLEHMTQAKGPNVFKLFANCMLCILDAKREPTAVRRVADLAIMEGQIRFEHYIERSRLMANPSILLPNDSLTIRCDVTINAYSAVEPGEGNNRISFKDESSLLEDLRSLFDSKVLTDVTLIVGKREFRAHKLLLMARSPVFMAAFQSKMMTGEENTLKIDDVSSSTFKAVLEYMCTGNTPRIYSTDGVKDVLDAARKYDLGHLKTMCEIELVRRIDIENAAEMLVFSEVHDATILKDKVTKYITAYSTDVMKTEAWKRAEEHHPKATENILQTLAAKRIRTD